MRKARHLLGQENGSAAIICARVHDDIVISVFVGQQRGRDECHEALEQAWLHADRRNTQRGFAAGNMVGSVTC